MGRQSVQTPIHIRGLRNTISAVAAVVMVTAVEVAASRTPKRGISAMFSPELSSNSSIEMPRTVGPPARVLKTHQDHCRERPGGVAQKQEPQFDDYDRVRWAEQRQPRPGGQGEQDGQRQQPGEHLDLPWR